MRAEPEPYCAVVNEVVIQGCEDTYVGNSNLTCRQTSAVFRTDSPRAERIHEGNGTLGSNGERLYSSTWGLIILIGRARRTYSDPNTSERQTRHVLQYTLVRWMRNYPRHVGTGPVLIEVGQGVVIGIEQVRCDIGSIAASENREVDHRERSSNVQTRGKSR
jgi:hypothetical protein